MLNIEIQGEARGREILERIAAALVPMPDASPLLESLRKIDTARQHAEPLTNADAELLREIWHTAPGPSPLDLIEKHRSVTPMTAEAFALFRRAFQESPQRPEWDLQAEFRDVHAEAAIQRQRVRVEWSRALASAVQRGELVAMNRPTRPPINQREIDGAVFDAAAVRAWLKPLGFSVSAVPEAAPAGEVATIAGPGTVRNSTKGKRAQQLDAEIEAAKREATNPSDAHAVYAVLRRWAEEEKPPFIGFVEDEGIQYLVNTETPKFFTLDALRKRMSRAAKAR